MSLLIASDGSLALNIFLNEGDNSPPRFHTQPHHLRTISPFLCVYVTHCVTQSYMKEMFGDDCIKALISDHDDACMNWQGTRFAHKLALEKLYYSCAFSCKHSKHMSSSRVFEELLEKVLCAHVSVVYMSIKFKLSCTVCNKYVQKHQLSR